MIRRSRSLEDLSHDKDLLFRVGQLTGAAIQHTHFCSLQEDENVKSMGKKLEEQLEWFYERKAGD